MLENSLEVREWLQSLPGELLTARQTDSLISEGCRSSFALLTIQHEDLIELHVGKFAARALLTHIHGAFGSDRSDELFHEGHFPHTSASRFGTGAGGSRFVCSAAINSVDNQAVSDLPQSEEAPETAKVLQMAAEALQMAEEQGRYGHVNLTFFKSLVKRMFRKRELWRGLLVFLATFCFYVVIAAQQFGVAATFAMVQGLESELVEQTIPELKSSSTRRKGASLSQIAEDSHAGIAWRDIGSFSQWFSWVEFAMLPVLFEDTFYNGDTVPQNQRFMLGSHNLLVGGFHFTQKRHGHAC